MFFRVNFTLTKPAPPLQGTSASTRTLRTKTSEKETSFPAVTRPAAVEDPRSGPDLSAVATDLSDRSSESEPPEKFRRKSRQKPRSMKTPIRTKLLSPKLNAEKFCWCSEYSNLKLWLNYSLRNEQIYFLNHIFIFFFIKVRNLLWIVARFYSEI